MSTLYNRDFTTIKDIIHCVQTTLNSTLIKCRWLCATPNDVLRHYGETITDITPYNLVGDVLVLSDLGSEGILIVSNSLEF